MIKYYAITDDDDDGLPNRNVALQMSGNAALIPVTETPQTTSTTTKGPNKWEMFQVYSKYRGSRVGYSGAGFGAAYSKALAMNNVTLIPRTEEEMRKTTMSTTSTTRPTNWIIKPTYRTPPTPQRPFAPGPVTEDPFVLYNQMKNQHGGRGPAVAPHEIRVTA